MTKEEQYKSLVEDRKGCEKCIKCGLINPSQIEDGEYDKGQFIGPWTRWQGNLNADIMIVGQDWGSQAEFKKMKGEDNKENPTNKFLSELMKELPSQSFFLTNAALCIRKGKAQGGLNEEWLFNCRSYLKEQIDIIKPKVIIALGQKTFYAVLGALELERNASIKFQKLVDEGARTHEGMQILPVFHPGGLGIRNSGGKDAQKALWREIGNQILTSQT
ncbi:MAG: uracil-DNA glycosylase family protein [Flavobacteriales bacterium]|nr:uracil-DNA glycosylase family protein [Flavobacteriales bacterium]